MTLEKLRLVVGWIVVIMWVVSLIVDAVDRAYEPPVTLHLVMMLVAGALFGPTLTGRRSNGNGGTP